MSIVIVFALKATIFGCIATFAVAFGTVIAEAVAEALS